MTDLPKIGISRAPAAEPPGDMLCQNCGNSNPTKFIQDTMLVLAPGEPPRSLPIGWTCEVCDEMVEVH